MGQQPGDTLWGPLWENSMRWRDGKHDGTNLGNDAWKTLMVNIMSETPCENT